ncbi:hypothetical protein HNP55_000293 [Paucibacter oligotrophus]|uniref:Uncharacterized protein n=1 Tax=Roseateles oligotrophus TaxID=1769250 RepID=A0A840L6G0_9BURK|nr:hypothetical protein [Roseateles oligotrophus]MBB4841798.1 hypothetical protein [Roseateles oligotrophus]
MISAVVSLLSRLVLTVASVLLVLALLVLALFTMLGLLLWSLARGRRPVVDLSGFRRAQQFRAGRARATPARPPATDVVDVEARELPEGRH